MCWLNTIYCHRCDGSGRVWLGTVGSGLVGCGMVMPSKRWVRLGKVGYGVVRQGSVWLGGVRFGWVW